MPALSFLLFWLLPASGGNGYLKDSESSGYSMLAASLGENVAIKCNIHHFETYVFLEKDGRVLQLSKGHFGQHVIFHITVRNGTDGGIYKCLYNSDGIRRFADSVELLIRDPSFPKPILSLEPMEEITIGQRVTMYCGTQREVKRFYLQKDDSQDWSTHSDMNVLTISDVSKKDAGRYSCSYTSVRQPYLLSEPSNSVELLLTDPQLPRPSISTSSRRPFRVGKDVTIMCEFAEGPAMVYLHKAGEFKKRARDSYARVTAFYLKKITLQDKGNYSCSWAKLRSPFLVSNHSHHLELLVLDDASMNQISDYAQINQSLVVVSGILVVLVFLLLSAGAFIWFKGKSNSIRQATQSSDEPSFRVMKRRRVATPSSTLAVGRTRIHKPLPKHDAPTETEDIIYADLKREAPHTQEEAKSYDGSEDLVYAAVFQHNSKGVQAQMEDE